MNAAAPYGAAVTIPIACITAAAVAALLAIGIAWLRRATAPYGTHCKPRPPRERSPLRKALAAAQWHARDWAWRPVLWWRVLVINRAVRQIRKDNRACTTAASTATEPASIPRRATSTPRRALTAVMTKTRLDLRGGLSWPYGQMPREEMLRAAEVRHPVPEGGPAPAPLPGRDASGHPYPALRDTAAEGIAVIGGDFEYAEPASLVRRYAPENTWSAE